MVPITAATILEDRISALTATVTDSWALASDTSIGFALAVLAGIAGLVPVPEMLRGDLAYGGIPAVARAGFQASSSGSFDPLLFLQAVDRIRGRPKNGRDQLVDDDIALLGIANGLSKCEGVDGAHDERKHWLLTIIAETGHAATWTQRARQLAGDLLDGAGRLRADPARNVNARTLDLVLRNEWPQAYGRTSLIGPDERREILAALLSSELPPDGELERSAVWLVAFRLLVQKMATDLVPDYDTLVEALKATQSALRRWVWDEKPNRQDIGPARWVIDDESHVQSFLWAILEPRFGDQLYDEQYLPGFGQKQPRFDFGLANLKTIVEVKIARTHRDFPKIEEEVAGDLGLYFSEPERYDRMVVYVYDDSDRPHPEQYDTLRSALTQRDRRIVDVIIVQRPGKMPNRNARQPWIKSLAAKGKGK
ncbi:hypothetical protein C5L14_17250 [Labrys okinawensis]|uniref:Uncharacterized protein n=1 Tax=Labrys okinawensis TaxID=346911 RepID=A0A2S9Q9H8_9HYPH|nr:hypothetical protein [Labrys okinawensis]PRH86006.1 hypothetical protein C5L14_17250 [Labrys okinawensis]